jgi:hypothetical protein
MWAHVLERRKRSLCKRLVWFFTTPQTIFVLHVKIRFFQFWKFLQIIKCHTKLTGNADFLIPFRPGPKCNLKLNFAEVRTPTMCVPFVPRKGSSYYVHGPLQNQHFLLRLHSHPKSGDRLSHSVGSHADYQWYVATHMSKCMIIVLIDSNQTPRELRTLFWVCKWPSRVPIQWHWQTESDSCFVVCLNDCVNIQLIDDTV